MKKHKTILLTTIFLGLSILSFGQSKWTCFPNNDSLEFNSGALGMFNYTDGSTWMINVHGIYIYNGSSWSIINNKNHLTRKQISTYFVDSKHNIWIFSLPQGFAGGGISLYNGKNWVILRKDDWDFQQPFVHHFYETSNGDVWLAISDNALYINPIDGLAVQLGTAIINSSRWGALVQYSQGESTTHTKDLPCSGCRFATGIYQTADKKLWFWTPSGRAFYYENGKFIQVSGKDGFHISTIANDIVWGFNDSKGDLLLTTRGKITMYNGQNWKSFGISNMAVPYSLKETQDGSLVIIASSAIYKLDGVDKWKEQFEFEKGIYSEHPQIAARTDRERNIWVLYNGELGVYNGSQFNWEREGYDLKLLFIDQQNRVWTANKMGVLFKENGTWENFDNIKKAKGILEDYNGTVWVSTENDGIFSYSDGKWQSYTEQNGLLSSKILKIFLTADNTLWVITDKGLCKFNRN